jgi:hypothetical protein
MRVPGMPCSMSTAYRAILRSGASGIALMADAYSRLPALTTRPNGRRRVASRQRLPAEFTS